MFTFPHKWVYHWKEHALYRQNPLSVAFEPLPHLNRGDGRDTIPVNAFLFHSKSLWLSNYTRKRSGSDISASVMLPDLVTKTACVDVKWSSCLPVLHNCKGISMQYDYFSPTAEQVSSSRLLPHGPGHRVRCSPTGWEEEMDSSRSGTHEHARVKRKPGKWWFLLNDTACVKETAFLPLYFVRRQSSFHLKGHCVVLRIVIFTISMR